MSAAVVKILAVCLIAAVLCVTVKPKAPEFALMLSVVAGVVLSLGLLKLISPVIGSIASAARKYKIPIEYFKVAVKALGIGYLTAFIADSCRDCGQSSLAAKAELAGKCAIFILSLPLLLSVLETAIGFIK